MTRSCGTGRDLKALAWAARIASMVWRAFDDPAC
jgi:hypothetical protein